MTCDIVLCAFGQTKQTAKVNNFEADEQRVAKEVWHPLHPRYYHHVNFTLSLVSLDAMNLQIVAQGTDNGRAMEGVTDIQGSVAVEGTNGEASEPEEKANDEQAEEKAKEVQVCVRVAWVCDVGVCVWVCDVTRDTCPGHTTAICVSALFVIWPYDV